GKTSDVVLTVSATPTCSISGPATTCPGSTVQFLAPSGMDSYSWSISGNGSISGPASAAMVTVNAGTLCGSGFNLTLNLSSNGCPASCNSAVMVIDPVPPTLTAPPDVALECPADTSPSNTGTATAQDGCSSVVVTFNDVVANNCGGTKVINPTSIATDACGSRANAVQAITVRDTAPPAIVAPAKVTLECPADTSPSNTGTATAQDGCSSVVV